MHREIGMQPMNQCGECSTLFLKFATIELAGETHKICPNPNCHGPSSLCTPIVEDAVLWAYMHILAEGNIPWQRRKNLRAIAESQMGEWNPLYRLL